jgi:uncharacterized NAD(P)/FAD-binding protein YdhS
VSQTDPDPAVIVIVGAGPRGTGVLERLLANLGELVPTRPVHVEVIDPYPPGAGRVWRADQPPLMWMNAVAENITMFTDETVTCEGPIRPGPSLSEWAATDDRCRAVTGMTFASRQIQSRYLAWVFQRLVAERPTNLTIRTHATLAVRVTDRPGGQQLVWLADRPEPLEADVVVLALGHLDNQPDKEDQWMADFASRHGLRYLPRAYSADVDLSPFRPGEKVIMRGFGLAFIDLMVLLTEGRGGEYRTEEDGRLRYLPCGDEPVMYVGSRRGVPYRAKMNYRLRGPVAPLPRFFAADEVIEQLAVEDRLDFRKHLWPLMAKEVGWGYYHELFTQHPDRVNQSWAEFAEQYAQLDWYSGQLQALVAAGVPRRADRLDFEALDRPLRGERFADFAELQERIRGHIAADVERRSNPAYSADLGALLALLSVYGQMPSILATGKLTARSHVEDVSGWWQGFFEYFGSGPPGHRIRQLLALSEAGIVHFLGADMWVSADEDGGVFRGGSASVRQAIEASDLVEARLPAPTLHHCGDVLLRNLYESGAAVEQILADEDGFLHNSGLLHVSHTDFRVVDRSGMPHPRRYALGPFTSVRYFATFARPRVNAQSFRQNDALARHLLRFLATSEAAGPRSAPAQADVREEETS